MSLTRIENGKVICVQCNKLVKCEVRGCSEIAIHRYISYIVCNKHLKRAKIENNDFN